jgi:hypothetical protein
MHVDDLFIMSKSNDNHIRFEKYMHNTCNETMLNYGKAVDFFGKTFNFIVFGQVYIAMEEATGLVVEFLSFNKGKTKGPNNYLAWAGAMHTTMGARYGPMTVFFYDQVPYGMLALEAGDLLQANQPDMEDLSASSFNIIRVLVITALARKKRVLRNDLPKCLNIILLKISVASQ